MTDFDPDTRTSPVRNAAAQRHDTQGTATAEIIDYRKLPRPRAGTWLDAKARHLVELVAEQGLVTLDPDQGYLVFAEQLRQQRSDIAAALHIGNAAAQRYITDAELQEQAHEIASSLSAEKPGTSPFSDTSAVAVAVHLWANAGWGLLTAARATRAISGEYADGLTNVAESILGVIALSSKSFHHSWESGSVIAAPLAGVLYVVRTLNETSAQVRIWESGVPETSHEDLAGGLAADAKWLALRVTPEAIERSHGLVFPPPE